METTATLRPALKEFYGGARDRIRPGGSRAMRALLRKGRRKAGGRRAGKPARRGR